MNNNRRKALLKAKKMLEEAESIISECQAEEEEAYENLPQSLQDGDKGTIMQEAANTMETALDALRDSVDALNEIDES